MAQVNHPASYEEDQEGRGAYQEIGLAITTGGGPSVVYGSTSLEAVEQFEGQQ
ncbi:MAG TPA: hypothetical protein VKA86_07705 [Candidatus Krumholzibacteria bacterium]|nr:hypothetical protein [Candidatus Krumholzibacteria bacterium]